MASTTSIIAVKLQGGFGNHLLAYFAAVILAQKQSRVMKIHLIPNELPDDSIPLRQDTRSALRRIVNPYMLATKEDLAAWKQQAYTAVLNDIAHYYAFLKEAFPSNTAVYVNLTLIGIHLMDYENHRTALKNAIQWTTLESMALDIQKEDVVVSFRLGMGSAEVAPTVFSAFGEHRLPFVYYQKAFADIVASRLPLGHAGGRLIVCSDNFEDAYIQRLLAEYSNAFSTILLVQSDTCTQFACILKANTLVSSNSTFSIVGAILSDAHTIYIPSFPPHGTFYRVHDETDPNLLRIDSKRFKLILLP